MISIVRGDPAAFLQFSRMTSALSCGSRSQPNWPPVTLAGAKRTRIVIVLRANSGVMRSPALGVPIGRDKHAIDQAATARLCVAH